ncbi:hypothetical protein C0995_010887 [Termitomyces sp. Mi166|nr:hypothetical protein C0995_010887 [Termitomyces sp. Mi166\
MVDFPWDKLKADTLRSICSDLGYPRLFHTKEVMMSLLKLVQESGLKKSFEHEKEIYEAKKEEKSAQPRLETPSPAKRTRGAMVVSDYDTRHKRKRLSDPGPRFSRRKSTKAPATTSNESQPKRPRGRLSKNKVKATPKLKASGPPSTRREIFDGILLSTPRPNSYKGKGKEKAEEYDDDEVGDEDAEGDVDMEHEDDGLIPDTQVESSLASSNKVLGNTMQQQTEAQLEMEVLPGSEEEVIEGPTEVASGVAPLGPEEELITTVETHQTYAHGELIAEDVSNVEEVLRNVAANGL